MMIGVFEPVFARQHHIQQDQVERLFAHPPQGAFSIRFDLYVISFVLEVQL
jgi:hypothetical protein